MSYNAQLVDEIQRLKRRISALEAQEPVPRLTDTYLGGDAAGEKTRRDNWMSWIEHFDGSALPSGWSWANDSAGDYTYGTPTSVSAGKSILTIGNGSSSPRNYYCYRAPSAYLGKQLRAILQPRHSSAIAGIRIDDSANPANHYAEVYAQWIGGSGLKIAVRYNTGSSSGDVTVLQYQPPALYGMMIITGGSAGNFWCNFYAALGGAHDIGNVHYVSGFSWTPNRIGFVLRAPYNYKYADIDAWSTDMY